MQTQSGALRGGAPPPRLLHPQATHSRPQARQQTLRVTAIAAPPRPSGASTSPNIEPLAEELKPIVEEKSVDWEKSGLKYLSNEARVRHSAPFLVTQALVPS